MTRARMLELILLWQEDNWGAEVWPEILGPFPTWRVEVAHPIHKLCRATGIPWMHVRHSTPERALELRAAYAAALSEEAANE